MPKSNEEETAPAENDFDAKIAPPDPAPVKVSLDDADDDDKEDSADERPRDQQGRWAEKKAERGRERRRLKDEHEELKGRHATLEQRFQTMEAERHQERQTWLQSLQARLPQAQAQQQAPAVSDIDQQLEDTAQLLEAELHAMERDPNRSPKRYNELRRRETALVVRKEHAELQRGQPQQQERQGGIDPQYAYRNQMMQDEFPWLTTNREAAEAAGAYRRYLISRKKPDNIHTDREACMHVQNDFGLNRGVPPVTQRQRQTLSGPPYRPEAAPRGSRPREVEIDPRLMEGSGLSPQQIARAVLGGDDDR
jgi:hypothetical protein